MPNTRIHTGDLIPPVQSLEGYFLAGGVSIIQAAFAHSYFVDPNAVRARTPYYSERARRSREHFPGLDKGSAAIWPGDGREIRLDDNQYAQSAWERYTGHRLARGSGYGLRHIWGNTHNPDAFTAGWNFCYMPFWAGMLTEDQHPHPELQNAIRQASWDLFFADDPVCQRPEFVENPGLDLSALMGQQPLLILGRGTLPPTTRGNHSASNAVRNGREPIEIVKEIRSQTNQSWINICKGVRALQGKEHAPFGTLNVEANAKSRVRRILHETGLTVDQLENLLVDSGFWKSR